MNAFKGRLVRLYLSDGGEPEAFLLVAGLRTLSVSFDSEPADVTTLASDGWREWLADGGVQGLSLAGEGISASAEADRLLFAMAVERRLQRCRIAFESGDRFEGDFALARFVRGGSVEGAETVSLALQSSGAVAFTAGGGA